MLTWQQVLFSFLDLCKPIICLEHFSNTLLDILITLFDTKSVLQVIGKEELSNSIQNPY